MSKLIIGIILKEGYTPELGGGFSYYDSVVEAIDEHQFHPDLDFRFISFNSPPANRFKKPLDFIDKQKYFSSAEKLGYRFTRLLKKSSFLYKTSFATSLKKRLHRREKIHLRNALIARKIDIIYNIVPFTQFLDYPFVETHWDIGHLSMYAFPEVTMNGVFEKRDKYYADWVSKAFAVFCESAAGKEELVRYKPVNPERIFVVPMFAGKIAGIRPDASQIQSALDKYSLVARKFFFYPAQFWSHKNHYGLVVAFRTFLDKHPGVKLVLTGSDKGNLGYIKSVIKSFGLEQEIVITGFISNESLFAFYKTAIALVMPSYLGPTNLPLLEAQAIGCAVICNDFKGHREMLRSGTNIFVKTGDYDDLCDAMCSMYNNTESPAALVNEKFNKENCMKSIETAFLDLSKPRRMFGLNFKQY